MGLRAQVDDAGRLKEIIEVFVEAGFAELIYRAGLQHSLPLLDRITEPNDRDPSPVRLREALEELGPTFIKLGQLMAQRPDIIPEPYVDELEKLEDRVEPIDSDDIVSVIEDSLDADIDELFASFETEPLASASIAQVHRATLQDGDDVIVKVRKPGVKQQVTSDLRLLETLVKEAEFASDYLRQRHIHDIFTQFRDWATDELDLRNEARNGERLRSNLADDNEINVPHIYHDYVTEEVLVEEYIDGVKINDREALEAAGIDCRETARNGVNVVIKQVLRDGFFQADPHPANVLVSDDGTINYIDFGIMGHVSSRKRRYLALIMFYAAENNAEGVVNAALKIGEVDSDAEIDAFADRVEDILLEMEGYSISDGAFSFAFLKIINMGVDHGVVMPTDLVAAGKGLVQAEGVGLDIFPDYRPREELKPLINRIVLQQNRPDEIGRNFLLSLIENRELLENAPRNASRLLDSVREHSKRGSTDLKVDTRTLAIAMIAVALIVTGTVLATGSSGQQLIGILELAGGLFLTFRLLND